MNGREIEQREDALERSAGRCAVCGKPLAMGAGQYAHKIANKEMWRVKYGYWVIDNTVNGEYVCSLDCNHSVDVGSGYGRHLEVITDVLIAEYRRTWGVDGLKKLTDRVLEEYRKLGVMMNA